MERPVVIRSFATRLVIRLVMTVVAAAIVVWLLVGEGSVKWALALAVLWIAKLEWDVWAIRQAFIIQGIALAEAKVLPSWVDTREFERDAAENGIGNSWRTRI